jgi:hypothetical protein
MVCLVRPACGSRADDDQEATVRKFLLLLVVAGAGYAVWRKVSARNADRSVWSEVTDSLT